MSGVAFIDNSGGMLTCNAEGIVLPRVSTAQRLALTNLTPGLQVYDFTVGAAFTWNGSQWVQSAGFDPAAANTQVLFRDGDLIGGDASLTWNKTTDLLTIGTDSATAVPGRRQRVFGSVRLDAGTNNPNGVELRVIGPTVPYHNHQMINGLLNGFASNSDHTHCQWLNVATGNTQPRQLGQIIYTAQSTATSFVMHGGAASALGTEFTNEHSIDTTGTIQNPVAPDYIGRVKLRYTVNPGIAAGETLLLQIITVQVAGIQASVYSALAATTSTLVGGLWEVEVDVEGLDPLHWNWNNRNNTTEQNANWQLNRLIAPLANVTQIAAVPGDSAAVNVTFSALPATVTVGKPCSVLVRAGTTLTGLTSYFLNSGYVSAVSGLVATVRLRNSRYRFWPVIGGSDNNPARFDVYLGVRDVAHDPTPGQDAVVQYRDADGVPTCHIFGPSDVGPTVNRTVVVGRNLVAVNSDEWVAGTDDANNRMSLAGNVLTVPGVRFDPTGEVLADYEEGTFTPNVRDFFGGATFTWSTNSGTYVRVGKTVTFTASAVCSGVSGSYSGPLIFSPPFATLITAAVTVYGNVLASAAKTQLIGSVGGLNLLNHYENGSLFDLGPHVQNGTILNITGTYLLA